MSSQGVRCPASPFLLFPRWRSRLFIRREKIIGHSVEEFVQSSLPHPKCKSQQPPRSCSVWYFWLSRDFSRVPWQSTATCCNLGGPYKLRIVEDTSPARTHNCWRVCAGPTRSGLLAWLSSRAPRSVRNHSLMAPILLHSLNEKNPFSRMPMFTILVL